MVETLEQEPFNTLFEEYKEASKLSKPEKGQRLLSQLDILSNSKEGIRFLYSRALELEAEGFFEDTAWSDPGRLSPALVKGTLSAGYPTLNYEILSDLRMLAHARTNGNDSDITRLDAEEYLQEVLVHNLEFAFKELTEETRESISAAELTKIYNLFDLILEEVDLEGIKEKLSDEILMVCEQRPIVTRKLRSIIKLVDAKLDLDPNVKIDQQLLYYVNAVTGPSELSRSSLHIDDYKKALTALDEDTLRKEARQLGKYMRKTGLDSEHLGVMVLYLSENSPAILAEALNLNPRGEAEFKKHKDFVVKLIQDVISEDNYQCLYGLAKVLENSLLSRQPVKSSLNNLRMININPKVEQNIMKSQGSPDSKVTAKQYLLSGTIMILGLPLGIGQGNNATCQSARGISMWSQHSPAKLVNMIITVAAQNNLVFRFENEELESLKLGKGLVDKLDYDLDAVSVVLVPHLDKIYSEMMRRASGRGEDPHKWVNPALYGQWIQVGFASAYSYLTNSIQDFKGFQRLFYATFHPDYNGGREMVYPNPLGIFVTSRSGAMIGFHAISLLRVSKTTDGNVRAYFLNPNNEGRQNWGQDIAPTVYGYGEKHGESSIPFDHMAARVYAFHFNALEAMNHVQEIPDEVIEKVETLAKESWGKSYIWSDFKKQW